MNRRQLRDKVFFQVGEKPTGNNLLQPAVVNEALNDSYQFLAGVAPGMFRRWAYIEAVDEQAQYLLPPDMFMAETIVYHADKQPLRARTIKELAFTYSDWETATAGTPTDVYFEDARGHFGIYPPPDVPAYYWSSATSIARVSGVVTVDTGTAHGLTAAGQLCSVHDLPGWNGVFKVASVATTQKFTYLCPGADATVLTAGTIRQGIRPIRVYGCIRPLPLADLYAANIVGGVQLLEADTQSPEIPDHLQMLLVHDAVRILAGRGLLEGAVSQARAEAADKAFRELLPLLQDYPATAMNIAPNRGDSTGRG